MHTTWLDKKEVLFHFKLTSPAFLSLMIFFLSVIITLYPWQFFSTLLSSIHFWMSVLLFLFKMWIFSFIESIQLNRKCHWAIFCQWFNNISHILHICFSKLQLAHCEKFSWSILYLYECSIFIPQNIPILRCDDSLTFEIKVT